MRSYKILPGLTTTYHSDWQGKIKELDQLNLKEVSFFATGMNQKERKEIYKALEKTGVESIPHVHLRSDFDEEEVRYLIDKYDTEIFNFHSLKEFQFDYNLSSFYDKIYLENTNTIPNEVELKIFAGLCIDFSHWEDGVRQGKKEYDDFGSLMKKYDVGCGHISAIKSYLAEYDNKDGYLWPPGYSSHTFEKLEEFDYLKKYKNYFPEILALELENSFVRQLEAKKYIEEKVLATRF